MYIGSIKKVLLLGSGGLRIGQAGEFDYSGSQAIKALKEENIEIVLLNPNIATVQTDPGMADKVYLMPSSLEETKKIIIKEKPDAILLGFGGQTALNLGLELYDCGFLEENNIVVLGTSIQSIKITEDRESFKQSLHSIGVATPKSKQVSSLEEAVKEAHQLGFPVMMRLGFSLGGLGSGKIVDERDLIEKASVALSYSPTLLIEEYLEGWKEIEYEIIRDVFGNTLTVCNMENFDPLGIHTGESIVVCPSQTLTNYEYHMLREVAIKVANHLEILGECNIQYALNPLTSEYRVIEVNARLSRSSALASKATGYPLAFVGTKLMLGYPLNEIKNAITQITTSFFEPALDYIVVKMPRWDTHKLKLANRTIGSEMKSVGEVMGIGRTFNEALHKALRMCNLGCEGLLDHIPFSESILEAEIATPTDKRLFAIAQFIACGGSIDRIHILSGIDKWFLYQIKEAVDFSLVIQNRDKELSREELMLAKRLGFSDKYIANLVKVDVEEIREKRISYGIVPVVKQIDTLAGAYDAFTNYLYMTYCGDENDISPSPTRPIVVLGSGPYAIGSSVEFDWCAVNTIRCLRKNNEYSIIINSNPETVSTDYDESDRLYFEEISLERVRDIVDYEQSKGIIVSVGGQIANNLALSLDSLGYSILGTSPKNIDMAEDRQKFSLLLNHLNIDQPEWIEATNHQDALSFAKRINFPVLVRPSYVLSGAAMSIIYNEEMLVDFLDKALLAAAGHSVVISKFILEGKEFEMDGVAQNGNIIIKAYSEHIEHAGVHSGDATIVLPPQRLFLETIRQSNIIAKKIVAALNISGPFNIQFIAKRGQVKVIECNLRASRSLPFVSKVTGYNFISFVVDVLLNKTIKKQDYNTLDLDYVGVKAPLFSYNRLKGSNPVACVEMASTGEVAHLGENLYKAFWGAWRSTEQQIKGKKILLSLGGSTKERLIHEVKILDKLGWEFYSTTGTHDYLSYNGIASRCLFKASDCISPDIREVIKNQEVDLIINIPRSTELKPNTDGFFIRRLAIDHRVPLITDLQVARVFLNCLIQIEDLFPDVKSWADYVRKGYEG